MQNLRLDNNNLGFGARSFKMGALSRNFWNCFEKYSTFQNCQNLSENVMKRVSSWYEISKILQKYIRPRAKFRNFFTKKVSEDFWKKYFMFVWNCLSFLSKVFRTVWRQNPWRVCDFQRLSSQIFTDCHLRFSLLTSSIYTYIACILLDLSGGFSVTEPRTRFGTKLQFGDRIRMAVQNNNKRQG